MNKFLKEAFTHSYQGVFTSHFPLILSYLLKEKKRILIFSPHYEEIFSTCEQSQMFPTLHLYPALNLDPQTLGSDTFEELTFLQKTYLQEGIFFFPTEVYFRKLPPKNFFQNHFVLKKNSSQEDLLTFFKEQNLQSSSSLEKKSFVYKGSIIDFYLDQPYRLLFKEGLLKKIQLLDNYFLPTEKELSQVALFKNEQPSFDYLRSKIEDQNLKQAFFKTLKKEDHLNLNYFLSLCFKEHSFIEEFFPSSSVIFFDDEFSSPKESDQFFKREKPLQGYFFFPFYSKARGTLDLKSFSGDSTHYPHYQKIKIGFSEEAQIKGYLDKSYILPSEEILFLKEQKERRKSSRKEDFFSLTLKDLSPGKYVIHKDFGLGRYLGLVTLNPREEEEFLLIEYSQEEKIYLPLYKINKISLHPHEGHPKLDSLQSKKFHDIKNKAKSSLKELAYDLLELQAQRKIHKRTPYILENDFLEQEELHFFSDCFFDLTQDQKKCTEEIFDDLESDNPMDRLLCGDVGVGKTEVAMRAIHRVLLCHKQALLLCPTSILSYQHYLSFQERFKNTSFKIEFLNRFKTSKEVKLIKEKIKEGSIDLLISTSKALSKDLVFRDLGLLVIDEEHKFGVDQKEILKTRYPLLDLLYLSATPIPRTLQLSLFQLKDLSLITTKPKNRHPIKTYFLEENFQTLDEAILREVKRKGQVFIVHYRIDALYELHEKLKIKYPQFTFGITHSQLSTTKLEKTFLEFYQGKIQILLTTILIESGIDLPNANTLIVFSSDRFGLAQLHQIKGRVGRGKEQAYAYFFVPKKVLKDHTRERLLALEHFQEGLSLSQQDLDLRGPGNILGAEQSGHVFKIGLELYLELLQEALNELENKKERQDEVEIQSTHSFTLPKTYLNSEKERLVFFKKLSLIRYYDELENFRKETESLYGDFPLELEKLYELISYKLLLKNIPLEKIIDSEKNLTLILKALTEEQLTKLLSFIGKSLFVKMLPPNKLSIEKRNQLIPLLEKINALF